MTVDRTLLRAPIDGLRQKLAEAEIVVPITPVNVADQVRSAWRNDLGCLGLDSTNIDQLAGALAGLAIGAKAYDGAPIGFFVTLVRMFDVLEPLLDDPTPWEPRNIPTPDIAVKTPWGTVPGRDMTAVAEELAKGNDVPRVRMDDEGMLRALAAGQYTGRPQMGGPGFNRVDKPPEAQPAPEPQRKVKRPGLWASFMDAYRAERARQKAKRR